LLYHKIIFVPNLYITLDVIVGPPGYAYPTLKTTGLENSDVGYGGTSGSSVSGETRRGKEG
jgi:hypothetical protein